MGKLIDLNIAATRGVIAFYNTIAEEMDNHVVEENKKLTALLKEACNVLDMTYKNPVMGKGDLSKDFRNKPEVQKIIKGGE